MQQKKERKTGMLNTSCLKKIYKHQWLYIKTIDYFL